MKETSLVKKLRIQRGQRAIILNPPSGYMDELDPLSAGVELSDTVQGTFRKKSGMLRRLEHDY
jgi:hypothetical protein